MTDHDDQHETPGEAFDAAVLRGRFQGDQAEAESEDVLREQAAFEIHQQGMSAAIFQRQADASLDVSLAELADAARDLVKALTFPLAVGVLVRLTRKPVAK